MGNINISNYRFPKKIMRLCAIGMVANGNVDNKEKECITNIIVRDIIKYNDFITREGFEKLHRELTPSYSFKKNCKESNPETHSHSYSEDIEGGIEFNIRIDTKSNEYKWVNEKYKQAKKEYASKNQNSNIVESIDEYYVWARYYVEFIVNRLERSNEQQGLFVDIGSYKKDEVKQELFDIILVILADNSILESERVAFMAIARIFRVRKVALIWDKLINVGKKAPLFNGTFRIRIQQKDIIDADDVLMIQEAICNYKIKGALREGLKNATIAEKERYVKATDQTNNFILKWAVWGFIISATIIYINISFLVEDKVIIREECLDKESPIENIYYNTALEELHESLYSKQDSSYIKKKQDSLDSKFTNVDVIVALASPDVRDFAELEKDAIKKAKKDITKRGIEDFSYNGDTKFAFEWMCFFVIWFAWTIFSLLWKIIKKIPYIYLYWDLVLLLTPLALFGLSFLLYSKIGVIPLSILHNPIWVFILMLCIELMIFLRQVNVEKLEDEKKKNSTGLLVVIVVMAIVSDMCISFIELPVNLKDGMLADKFAAALLLGCLCFFIGRFLNMYSLQERINISNMEASIKRIVEELKSSPEK